MGPTADSGHCIQTTTGDRTIVGVNALEVDNDPHVDIEEVDPADEEQHRERLAAIKNQRETDADAVKEALTAVRRTAAGDDNLMPVIIDAVKSYCPVGEIPDELRAGFGEHQPGI